MPTASKPTQLRNKMLGIVLQDARKAVGRTVREAAENAGLTTGVLAAFESGRRSITLPELEALAYTYDVPIRHLLLGAKILTKERDDKLDLPRLVPLRQKMIATRLRQLRAEKNLRLSDLGKRSGLPGRRIKAYESGVRSIPLPDLESIALGLDVEVTEFLEMRGPVGEWELDRESEALFEQLPSDIRRFAAQPLHEPYIRLAMRLSNLPATRLREIAESLLDITL